MEKVARLWLAIGAAICGILAGVGCYFVIDAFHRTPDIHDVIFHSANGVQSTQSKFMFLCLPLGAQIFVFGSLLSINLRWGRFVRAAAAGMAPHDLWSTRRVGLTFATHCKLMSAGATAASAITLYGLINNVRYLLVNG